MTDHRKARVVAEARVDNSFDLADAPLGHQKHPNTSNLHQAVRSSGDANGSGVHEQSPLVAVRAHCVGCCNGSAHEASQCPARRCPLWMLRSGHRPKFGEIKQNWDTTLHPTERAATAGELHDGSGAVLKAIRRRCIDCSGGSQAEVGACRCDTCPLHPFRMGKNPNIRLSPERKTELLMRLQQ